MNIEEILNDKFVTEIKEAFISEINELVENDKLGLHKYKSTDGNMLLMMKMMMKIERVLLEWCMLMVGMYCF
jgi:hypothetical protein